MADDTHVAQQIERRATNPKVAGVNPVMGSNFEFTGFIIGYLLFMFNVLDVLFTCSFVAEYGIEVEINPLMRWMISNTGVWWIVFKILFGAYFFYLVTLYWRYSYVKYLAVFAVFAYGLITVIHGINIAG